MRACIPAIVVAMAVACPLSAQEFDLKDGKKSVEWLFAKWQPVIQANKNGNLAAQDAAKRDVDAALAKLKGKDVDDTAIILDVQPTFSNGKPTGYGVRLLPIGMKQEAGARYSIFLYPMDKNRIKKPFGVQDDWILKVRARDKVRIRGTITSVQRPDTGGILTVDVYLFLSDAKLSPAPKK